MILTYRRPGPPDTHGMTMVNNVIEVLNYVIAARPLPLNSVIADTWRPRADFTADTDGRDWHRFYDTYLEGRPVLDTLQIAVSAVVAVASGP